MATANFTDSELACKHCGRLPSIEFQQELQALRNIYGAPIRLNSAYRCPEHNNAVSHTGFNGPHTKGAVDISVSGHDSRYLVQAAVIHGIIKLLEKSPFSDTRRTTLADFVSRLKDPDFVRESARAAWGGMGIDQNGDKSKRFIHLDNVNSSVRPNIWSYD